MALTNNPNKAKGIEKRWRAEARRKFAELKRFMRDIPLVSITTNVDAQEQARIDVFQQTFDREAIGLFLTAPWQNKYQTEAYRRGIERSTIQARALLTSSEIAAAPLLAGTAANLLSLPTHSNELNFLHDRANDKLAKWITALLEDTKSILHENVGIVPADQIFQQIADRINVTTSRSEAIAVTEVAQASQRAVINQTQEIQVSLDQAMSVRWNTVKDSKVRHLHANWHGKLFSPEQAARNITISPWNCRCGLITVVTERDSERVKAKFAEERKILLAKEKN